jgi:hypothetical protein
MNRSKIIIIFFWQMVASDKTVFFLVLALPVSFSIDYGLLL